MVDVLKERPTGEHGEVLQPGTVRLHTGTALFRSYWTVQSTALHVASTISITIISSSTSSSSSSSNVTMCSIEVQISVVVIAISALVDISVEVGEKNMISFVVLSFVFN